MTKAAPAQKLALTAPETIPLDKLSIHDGNVRQIKAGISIENLAADIARRGLLQSLSVRPLIDDAGAETGRYGVQAGGRRLRALQLLVKQKKLAKNAPVPCIVRSEGFVEADSLAENTEREALHPIDQFRAFAALRDKGQGEDTIAAAFGVTPAVVKQRLRLANASPLLLKAYEDDETHARTAHGLLHRRGPEAPGRSLGFPQGPLEQRPGRHPAHAHREDGSCR